MVELLYEQITGKIIGVAMKVHRELGPGFVEKIYQRAMYLEMKKNGIVFEREKKISLFYNRALLGYFQADFVVEKEILVELKAVSDVGDLHLAQMISYLKAANKKVGLIFNFAKKSLEFKRIVA